MRALSFIGTGISSSELSLSWAEVAAGAYRCDLDACAVVGTGFDSARLIVGLVEGAFRSPDRSDDFLVGAVVEWLPEPIGVGEAAVAIWIVGFFSYFRYALYYIWSLFVWRYLIYKI